MNNLIKLFQEKEIVKDIIKGKKNITISNLTLEALAISSAFLANKKTGRAMQPVHI